MAETVQIQKSRTQLFHAGRALTAKDLNLVGPNIITQGSDAVYTSSTTPTATNITFTPDVSATYYYELFIAYTANGTPDFGWRWNAPEALFCRYTLSMIEGAAAATGTPATEPGADIIFRRPANATFIPAGGTGDTANGLPCAFDRGTFATTATSSAITLECAQFTSNAAATRLRADTTLIYQRIS